MTTYVHRDGKWVNKATGLVDPPRFPGQICKPRINTSDEQAPTLSMADGKYYTSKAKMRESYKPGGNPQGATFVEIGDDQSYKKAAQERRKPDVSKITESVDRAFADLQNGRFND